MQSSSSPSYLSPSYLSSSYLFSSFMSLSPFLLLCHPCCHCTCHHYHYSRCPNHSYHFQFILSRGEKQRPASYSLSLPMSLIVLINVDCCSTVDHYLSGKWVVWAIQVQPPPSQQPGLTVVTWSTLANIGIVTVSVANILVTSQLGPTSVTLVILVCHGNQYLLWHSPNATCLIDWPQPMKQYNWPPPPIHYSPPPACNPFL